MLRDFSPLVALTITFLFPFLTVIIFSKVGVDFIESTTTSSPFFIPFFSTLLYLTLSPTLSELKNFICDFGSKFSSKS